MREPESIWYGGASVPLHLKLLEAVYRPVAALHQRWRRSRARHPGAPVIVIGNLTVGGSGKTPLLIHLAKQLSARYRVGVVSRGYGSTAGAGPRLVSVEDSPSSVGDEPLLIARETSAPVMVGSNRVDSACRLVDEHGVEILLSDDGLQHGQLARDLEIVVVDEARGFGNRRQLPAGPLREPLSRLETVDFVIHNGSAESMMLTLANAVNLQSGESRPLDAFVGKAVHAVAGIGHPGRFFASLKKLGIEAQQHPFPDHHPFSDDELAAFGSETILTTSKDAVKLRGQGLADCWEVPVTVALGVTLEGELLTRIDKLMAES
ncbi:MAG: tetraacyldisaccharide 4'-kinase [Pseudomonadota bacterium]